MIRRDGWPLVRQLSAIEELFHLAERVGLCQREDLEAVDERTDGLPAKTFGEATIAIEAALGHDGCVDAVVIALDT